MSNWGGDQRGYSFLSSPVDVFGAKIALESAAGLSRRLRPGLGPVPGLPLYVARHGAAFDRDRSGRGRIVGVNVQILSALAFAAGSAMAAMSGRAGVDLHLVHPVDRRRATP